MPSTITLPRLVAGHLLVILPGRLVQMKIGSSMHTTGCALSGCSCSNPMGLRSAWPHLFQVSPPSIASKLQELSTTPTAPGMHWEFSLPSSLRAQFTHAANNPAILYSCMLHLMDPNHQGGISTALYLHLNGGRTLPSPEVVCSSSGRKKWCRNGVRRKESQCGRW